MSHRNVYVGETLCKNVYVGTQLVWTQAPQLPTYSLEYSTGDGATTTISLSTSGMPIALVNYPERVEEVRLSTGLVLPHTHVDSLPFYGVFGITLTDTLANLGVPLYTTVTLEIRYRPD